MNDTDNPTTTTILLRKTMPRSCMCIIFFIIFGWLVGSIGWLHVDIVCMYVYMDAGSYTFFVCVCVYDCLI